MRPYYNAKKKQIALSEERLPMHTPTVDRLFEVANKIVQDIPEQNRYNLFWTAAHCKPGTRELISQDIIPFDIDGVHMPEKENYIKPIADALNVDISKCAVIWTGNGIQVIVKIKRPIDSVDFFKKNREAYRAYCDKINQALKTEGLPGSADSSVFSPARLLRLPHTTNIKPMLYTNPKIMEKYGIDWDGQLNIQQATLFNGKMESIDFPLTAPKKQKEREHSIPDHKTINEECLFVKSCLDGTLDVHEPDCYRFLGIVGFYEDDDQTAWQGMNSFSSPTIDTMDKDAKLEQAKNASGPRTCVDIGAHFDCSECIHYKKIKTPLHIKSPEYHLNGLVEGTKTKKPTEMQVVHRILKTFDLHLDPETSQVDSSASKLMQQYGTLFLFVDTHWVAVEEAFINQIKRTLGKLYSWEAGNNKIESTYRLFLTYVPHPPEGINLFTPPHGKINFTNGTLHVDRPEGSGEYQVEFREHSRTDYMTNLINLRYDPEMREQNLDFLDMLDRYFASDQDKEEKIQALKEMYGAALMPIFPRLFFLHGKAGAGKSTICIILSHLLDQENLSRVQPCEFKGFLMEGMAGKLVNIVTDIRSNTMISDDVVKQIEDRVPYLIQRKNQKNIYAPLPCVHIFGANKLPATFDGSTRAHDRRWTFIGFNNAQVKKTKAGQMDYMRDYGNIVYERCPQGVLNFALEGLFSLIKNNGMFTMPSSGRADIDEWQIENDPVALFVQDIIEDQDCVKVKISPDDRIKRPVLWERFQLWTKKVGRERTRITRNKFYKAILEHAQFSLVISDGHRYVKGIKDIADDY